VQNHELVGLYEESVIYYDELEASYEQTTSDTWFKTFHAGIALDDSKDILKYASKGNAI
jgi:Fic family protein